MPATSAENVIKFELKHSNQNERENQTKSRRVWNGRRNVESVNKIESMRQALW